MTTLKLIQFSGETPRLLPRLLPESGAQRAENVRLDNGGLTPIRQARLVDTVIGIPEGQIKTIYKNGEDWLAWDKVVNAAAGPVASDRLYYTGDGAPKMLVAGTVYALAVPFPAGALTATLTGTGTGNITQRLYVYTYVTDFGEESEPSPISNPVDWMAGQGVTLSGFAAPPAGRNITKQRIYRSQSSVSAGTDLFFIAERAASASNYADSIAVDGFGEVLPSREWNAPPDGLTGLISLPNGMMAAFVGKDLYFCEPFRPHAWPEVYVLTMDYPIVALGAYGTTLVVTTTGTPYLVQGQAPENMVQEKLELNLPCINARGLVDLGYAVAYPSTEGLVVVASGSANVATGPLLTRSGWLQTSPATFVAGQYDGRYFASYEFIELDNEPTRGTFEIDLTGNTPFLLRGSRYAEACYYDITTSALYMLSGVGIYEWDALGQLSENMTWKSKQFVLPEPTNFGAILIEGADALTPEQEAVLAAERAEVAAQNAILFAMDSIGGEINGAPYNTYQVNGDALGRVIAQSFVFVRVIADGVVVAVIDQVNEVVRLPSGFKARNWEMEVNGTTEIAQITLGTTVKELNNV
jgi:hypothetical protein